MKKKFIRAISMMLALVTAAPAFVQTAGAVMEAEEMRCVYLEERDLGEDVLTSGNFFIASKETTLAEDSDNKYLLRIGRGGENLPAAAVRVNLMDTTADYGEDYKVRVHNGFGKAESLSEDSILDQMLAEGDSNAEYNATDVMVNGGVEASAEELKEVYTEALEKIENSEEMTAEEKESAINELLAAYRDSLDMLGMLDEETEENVTAESGEEAAKSDEEAENLTPAGLKAQIYGYEDNRIPMDGSSTALLNETVALTDMMGELYSFGANAGLTLDFAEGETEKYLEIIPIDNNESDGTRIFSLYLLPADSNVGVDADASVQFVIEDDEDPVTAKVGFSDTEYESENGFVSVTVVREEALNETVQVDLSTKDITAVNGTDYSKVSTTLVFPFGITKRTIKIPVYTEDLEEAVEFKLCLSDPIGCEITDNTAYGKLYPNSGSYGVDEIDAVEEESSAMTFSSKSLRASSAGSTALFASSNPLQPILESKRFGDPLTDFFNVGVDDNHGVAWETPEGGIGLDVDTSFWDDNGSGMSVYLAAIPKETAITPYQENIYDLGIAYDVFPDGDTPLQANHYYSLMMPAVFNRGYEIVWKLDSAKPSWPKVQFYNVTDNLYLDSYKKGNWTDAFLQVRQYRSTVPWAFFSSQGLSYYARTHKYLGKWNYTFAELLYESELERHESRTQDFYSAYPVSYGLVFNVQQRHTSSRDPELEIQQVRPILRPFEITLRTPEPLWFYDKEGVCRPSTDISILKNATSVNISGESNNSNTIVAYKGEKITVSLDELNPYTYIKSVKVVRHGGDASQIFQTYKIGNESLIVYNYTVIADNLEPGTRSYTFTLDEEFIRNISSYNPNDNYVHDALTFEKIGQEAADDGLKGMFDIEVELGHINTSYTMAEHNDAVVETSQNYYDAANGTHVLHQGDYITVTQRIKNHAADSKTANTIKVETLKYVSGVPERSSFLQFCEPGTNKIVFFNDGYSWLRFTPNPVPKDNQIVVKIQKSHVENLNMTAGIFEYAGEPEDRGDGYLYYTVVPKEEITVGKYYKLSAYPLDSSTTELFWILSRNGRSFAQHEFYYCAEDTVEDNVIELRVGRGVERHYLAIDANFMYEESSLTGIKGKSWIPAPDACVTVTGREYGISNDFGELIMNPYLCYNDGYSYLRIKVEANGSVEYRDLYLHSYIQERMIVYENYTDSEGNTSVVKAFRADLGTIEVSKYHYNSPRVISVWAGTPGAASGQVLIDNDYPSTFMATVCNDGSVYYDSEGKQRTEKVIGVNILVLDQFSNDVVYTIPMSKVTALHDDVSTWEASRVLYKDFDGRLYKAGDKIYIQVITDRVKGNGMALDENGNLVESAVLGKTTYAPINTNYILAEANMSQKTGEEVTLPFSEDALPIDDFIELPFIGTFNAMFTFSFLSLTMTQLPENGFRLALGYFYRGNTMIEDYSLADDGVKYPMNPFKSFSKVVDNGGAAILGRSSYLASRSFVFRPTVALYIDFGITAIYDEETDTVNMGGLTILGHGLMFGVVSNLHLVQYGMAGPVPVYMGLDINLAVYLLLGSTQQITIGEMPDELFAEKEGIWDFNTVVQSLIYATGYVGAGLAGTLGVRGGLQFDISAIWNPTIQNRYPEIEDILGLLLSVSGKIWIDALLGSIPVSLFTCDNLRLGYYKHPSFLNDDELREHLEEMEKEENQIPSGNTSAAYRLSNNSSQEGTFIKKRTEASEWLPYGDVSAMSTYAPENFTILQEGGFDNAEPQLLVLDDKTVLLAYITDDSARSDDDRTALMLAIYRDGSGWSAPVMVQTDGTADFEPDLCDAGDNVLLSWVSREPGDDTAADDIMYLADQEIYAVILEKSDLTYDNFNAGTFSVDQNSITKLNDDSGFEECYDYSPVGLYDDITGDMIVYYLKAGVDPDAKYEDAVSATRNGCVIVYMLYDGNEQRWLTDKYFDEEYPDDATKDIMIEMLAGQRFLPTALGGFGGAEGDPAIIDFDAISYNGLGVYTFTVDADNNLDTSEDRELFVQLYNFEEHKTYHAIRLTENNICEARPQLTRTGDNTYLFWLSGNTDVYYINVSELIKEGINPDGTLKRIEDVDENDPDIPIFGETGKPCLDYGIVYFNDYMNEENAPALASFKPFVDENNNLYITWLQQVKDEAGNASHEIFVSSLPDYSDMARTTSWADPVAISELGMFQDQVAFAAFGDGKLLTVSNVFNMDLSENGGISDYFLVATNYTSVGSMTVTDAALKTGFQGDAPTLNVSMEIRNIGMKDAKGYDLKAVLVVNDEEVGVVHEENYMDTFEEAEVEIENPRILPTHSVISSFSTALPADIADGDEVAVRFYVTETGFEEEAIYTSESVTICPQYELNNVIISQQGDEYLISGIITNTGMVDGSGDSVLVELEDLYKVSDADDKVYLNLPIGELAKTQSTQLNASFRIPAEHLAYGYVNLLITPARENGEETIRLGASVEMTVSPASPVITVNGGTDTIVLNDNEALTLTADYSGSKLRIGGIAQYSIDNPGIAYIEDGKLIPVANGTAELTVTIKPYGGLKKITVVVKSADPDDSESEDSEEERASADIIFPNLYRVSVECGEGGKVNTSRNFLIARGASRTIRITADEGFQVTDVLVNGKSVGAVKTYTIKGAAQDYTVSVIFEEIEG